MAKGLFDRRIGKAQWDALPSGPGVYRFCDAEGRVIYVGKAKNLRRRLGQYRRARRLKAHFKMREILRHAFRLEFESAESELAALEQELVLIQTLRPRFNVAGAYSFLYPCVVWNELPGGRLVVGITFDPAVIPWPSHGAYRSRHWTREALESLESLLGYLAYREPWRALAAHAPGRFPRWTRLASYRGLDPMWIEAGARFFKDGNAEFLSSLAIALLEKVSARRDAAQVAEHLAVLRRFRTREIQPLLKAVRAAGTSYPVPQDVRDLLFLRMRHAPERARSEQRRDQR